MLRTGSGRVAVGCRFAYDLHINIVWMLRNVTKSNEKCPPGHDSLENVMKYRLTQSGCSETLQKPLQNHPQATFRYVVQ